MVEMFGRVLQPPQILFGDKGQKNVGVEVEIVVFCVLISIRLFIEHGFVLKLLFNNCRMFTYVFASRIKLSNLY